MEDLKDRDERNNSIKFDMDVEELESRIAPSVSGGASGDGRISFNHNETMLRDSI
jgi:hypothetical protein